MHQEVEKEVCGLYSAVQTRLSAFLFIRYLSWKQSKSQVLDDNERFTRCLSRKQSKSQVFDRIRNPFTRYLRRKRSKSPVNNLTILIQEQSNLRYLIGLKTFTRCLRRGNEFKEDRENRKVFVSRSRNPKTQQANPPLASLVPLATLAEL